MSYLSPTLYFGLYWREQLRVAPVIELTDEQASELTRLARSKRTSVRPRPGSSLSFFTEKSVETCRSVGAGVKSFIFHITPSISELRS
jgi:hypothetical protein